MTDDSTAAEASDRHASVRRIRLYVLIAAIVVGGGLFQLVPRLLNARRAYIETGERNQLKAVAVAYHVAHERDGSGPKDLDTLRQTTAGWSGDSIDPTQAYDWVESGRLEVVWNGSFAKSLRAGGGGIGGYHLAREVPAEGAEEAWVVFADGAVERVPVGKLDEIPPLLTTDAK